MAKRNRLSIDFKGFEEIYEKLDKLNRDTKKVTEKALEESFNYVTPNIEDAIEAHKLSGETQGALVKKPSVEWIGTTAVVKVGFDIQNGGLPSIFLMYGTPTITPDRNLYNAIYGSATKNNIKKIQKIIFEEELK